MNDSANEVFDGRYVRCWTQEQISFLSDVIASATLLQTKHLGALEGFESWEAVGVRAIEMTFSVSRTFKGKVPPDSKIVVHCYEAPQARRLETAIEADQATQSYLLYLLQEANNRFVPTSGSMQARMCIRPEPRNRPEWTDAEVAEGAEAPAANAAAQAEPAFVLNPEQGKKLHQTSPYPAVEVNPQ